MKIITMMSDLVRDRCVPSDTIDTSASVRLMALVSAAKNTSRKNTKPMTVAKVTSIVLNTSGRVMNMSDGPDFAATASAEPMATNAAGTIMRPAKNETPKSKPAMRVTEDVRLSCLRM